jgi:hypothetical protein
MKPLVMAVFLSKKKQTNICIEKTNSSIIFSKFKREDLSKSFE